ncbi:hypothetical protein [Pseudomonas aeruginosa]|uniref:hypothetical protein n=1 Tax=Pseudomonas aeruginosa TaxID=287 RepID=UPI001C9535A6|nr:hypothetical protein [Pseudomonas aeruginosa]WAJ81454.1 hypothetical protein PAC42_16560 [Pseudomonas aeruginosa]HBO1414524.1 hypothetical protein [Pseudomonas aeruginosa]HBO3807471.1 hypothetical protein [Pseudomonas aeruginosa]HBO7425059.1 hypothetical protein [Pseudomonas aeruginosa]HCL3530013.1 hypothetical protein [Pseudomonas aeruginosa]
MKAILNRVAVIMLVAGGTVSTVWAEGGSDYLMNFHLRQQALASQRAEQDTGQRFAQILVEQPTAAGPMTELQSQSIQEPAPTYRSPIYQDRALYGSGK